MKHVSAPVLAFARLLVLAASLTTLAVHADEYAEVSQLLRAGKLVEAQARVDRHLAAKPRDPQMRLYKGVIQRESGRQAEAMITFTRLTEDYPDLPEPYNNLAVIYAAQGQYDKARVSLEKALHTNPSYATAHDNLGDIYARLAGQAYSKALQIDGGSPPPPPRLALIRELATPAQSQASTVLAAAKPAPVEPPAKPATAPTPAKPAPVVAAAPVPAPAAPPKPPAPVAKAPLTPPAPPATVPTSAPDSQRQVEQAVRAWARAWADRNMTQYLAAYGKDFETPGKVPRGAWEEDRRLRITGKAHISVNLLELQITVKDNRAVAKFRQDYKADALAVLSRKTLELVRTGDRWLIVKESSGS